MDRSSWAVVTTYCPPLKKYSREVLLEVAREVGATQTATRKLLSDYGALRAACKEAERRAKEKTTYFFNS